MLERAASIVLKEKRASGVDLTFRWFKTYGILSFVCWVAKCDNWCMHLTNTRSRCRCLRGLQIRRELKHKSMVAGNLVLSNCSSNTAYPPWWPPPTLWAHRWVAGLRITQFPLPCHAISAACGVDYTRNVAMAKLTRQAGICSNTLGGVKLDGVASRPYMDIASWMWHISSLKLYKFTKFLVNVGWVLCRYVQV